MKRPDLEFTVIRDSADTIMERLTGVGKTVLEAVLLAMLILLVFFGDLKASLIVGSSMPISIMATLVCMWLAGLNLNVVTLGALMIAVGMMTDNAVVVIEMCFRQRQSSSSFKEAAYEGTSIVLNSVIGSTITTVVVYVPLSLMEGLSGQMFKQLGYTIIFALIASLISAITIIPLCFMAYQPVEKQDIPMTRFLRWVSKHYAKVLRFVLKWKKTVFLVSILVLIVTISLARFLRTELMTQTDEGIVNVSLAFRPNLKIEEMDKEVKKLEEFVMAAEEIEDYSVTIARTSASATITANKSDDSLLSTQEIVDKWNQELKGFSNLFEATASAGSSMGRSSMGSPNTKEFDFVSTDRDKLKATANEMVRLMENTEGVLRAESSVTETGSKAKVVIDPVMARAKGFSAMQLAGLVYVNMSGSDALDVTIDSNTYTITVEYPRGHFETISDVEAMTFTNAQGLSVPLTEVGEVRFASAPQTVVRKDGLYQASVTATMTALTKDAVTDVLQEKADKMVLDPDVSFATDAQTEMMQEEFAAIGQAIFIGVFLVFMVMAIQFNSIADSILIMTCIPFAGVGSILFLLAINAKISMTSLMGVLMLAGIVVNNGIILIDMAIQNQESGMDTVEALVDAGAGRLRPILMTTLTTILAMVPTAVGWSKDSSSLQGMAGVIVGGLIASTILTLLLLPTFYLLLDRLRARVARLQEKRRLKNEERVRAIEEKERQRHAELMEKEKAQALPKKEGPDPLPVSKPDDEEGNAAEEGEKAKEEAPKDGED